MKAVCRRSQNKACNARARTRVQRARQRGANGARTCARGEGTNHPGGGNGQRGGMEMGQRWKGAARRGGAAGAAARCAQERNHEPAGGGVKPKRQQRAVGKGRWVVECNGKEGSSAAAWVRGACSKCARGGTWWKRWQNHGQAGGACGSSAAWQMCAWWWGAAKVRGARKPVKAKAAAKAKKMRAAATAAKRTMSAPRARQVGRWGVGRCAKTPNAGAGCGRRWWWAARHVANPAG